MSTASDCGKHQMKVVTRDEYARLVRAEADEGATNPAAEHRTVVQTVKAGVVIAQAIYVAGRDPEYQVSQQAGSAAVGGWPSCRTIC
jgi:hypothetical protein